MLLQVGAVARVAPSSETRSSSSSISIRTSRARPPIWLDKTAFDIDVSAGFTVTDELTGESYRWGEANYVRLDPDRAPAHIFRVTADQPGAGN